MKIRYVTKFILSIIPMFNKVNVQKSMGGSAGCRD